MTLDFHLNTIQHNTFLILSNLDLTFGTHLILMVHEKVSWCYLQLHELFYSPLQDLHQVMDGVLSRLCDPAAAQPPVLIAQTSLTTKYTSRPLYEACLNILAVSICICTLKQHDPC